MTYKTLDDLRQSPNGYVVMEGGDGAWIYLAAPVSFVQCPRDNLFHLLFDINKLLRENISYGELMPIPDDKKSGISLGPHPFDSKVYYADFNKGDYIGGEGHYAAYANEGVYFHPKLTELGWGENVLEVLKGTIAYISGHTHYDPFIRRLDRCKATSFGYMRQMYHSLEEVVSAPDGYVAMTGGCGGWTFLVVPASQIQCSEDELIQLIGDLASVEAGAKSLPEKTFTRENIVDPIYELDILYDALELGDTVGGANVGYAQKDLWLSDDLKKKGVESEVRAVLAGKKDRIRWPL